MKQNYFINYFGEIKIAEIYNDMLKTEQESLKKLYNNNFNFIESKYENLFLTARSKTYLGDYNLLKLIINMASSEFYE
jgi:ubiquinone/menaquinone biosynthesis C-methylase UbiE